MKKLQLPSSYAVLSEEEQRTVSGGGELKDSLDEFLGSLHLYDFTLGEGLVSFSVTFVPMLLFHVFRSAYNFAENTYNNLVNWFGFHDDTLSALQSYTDDMRQKRQERGV